MKKVIFVNLFFCALLHTFCTLPLLAGVPQLINFQGELTDNAANPLNGSYSITFGLWSHQTSTDSAFCQWTETHSSVTVTDGLFNVLLGSVKTDTLGEVFESNDTLYLEKTVGGETLSPRVEVGSLGYAMRAGMVGGVGATDNVFPPFGNVGIGTTSPDEMLVVYNSDGETWLKLHGAFESKVGIIFEDHGEEPPWERCVGKLYHDGGGMVADLPIGGFQFRRDGNPKLTIEPSNGKVGIGTSSPDSQLEIRGAIDQTFPVLHLVEEDSHQADIFKVDTFEEDPIFVIKPNGEVGINTTNPDSQLEIRGVTDQTIPLLHLVEEDSHQADIFKVDTFEEGPIFVIKPNGEVGIGTSGPDQELHIYRSNDRVDVRVESSLSSFIDFGTGEEGHFVFGYGNYPIYFGTNGSEKMRVTSDGKVGISTSNPNTKLAVAGLTGTSSYNNVRVNTATGDFYYESSSNRYKENIRELGADFQRILEAEPMSYTDKTSGQDEIGYIAEDFDKLGLDELVIYDGKNRPNGLRYDRISLYLVEIIKDQQQKISSLEERLEKDQQQEIASLKERLELVERR